MQRSLISLISGAALAVLAIAILTMYVHSVRAGGQQVDVSDVVLARKDIVFGTKLTPELLKVSAWPRDSIPAGAFHSIADIFKNAKGDDRIVLSAMVADEPVLASKISGFGAKPTLSHEVAPGMRAVSIRINDVSGVSGFILPGDRVDVMLTRQLRPGGRDDLVTDVILQDVTVLGIDQLSNQQHDKPVVARTATVQVTPEEAAKLALAQEAGTLSLALRNVATSGTVKTSRVDTADLADARPAVAHHAYAPAIRIIYGGGK